VALLLSRTALHAEGSGNSNAAVPPPEKIVDLMHVLGPNLPDFHKGNQTFD
jgi:hypothetical protein